MLVDHSTVEISYLSHDMNRGIALVLCMLAHSHTTIAYWDT